LYSEGRVINDLEGVYLLSSCLHLLSSLRKKILEKEKKILFQTVLPGHDNPE
jgi:hypothetical protein